MIGAAHVPGSAPRSMRNTKGYIRGFDAESGVRKWIFHTIPGADEFGNDTWLNDSWRYTGNTGVWGQISADLELGIVYLPTEMPTNDYYGGHRHGDNLYSDSLVAVDIETGDRAVALPVHPPRRLGLGPAVRPDPGRRGDRSTGSCARSWPSRASSRGSTSSTA